MNQSKSKTIRHNYSFYYCGRESSIASQCRLLLKTSTSSSLESTFLEIHNGTITRCVDRYPIGGPTIKRVHNYASLHSKAPLRTAML
ncbi:hypothetical protein HMPREF9004_0900 [Schaalia cardiffensis F0333]|uniref:Uncharacterized protein n=1 Tax=Schaalia cardiffensis F0333 TaxID=888050 RepID=N6X3Q4_9ACTO|nr:hypothetical protein [Schaalia cardiffensis]ENO18331.1 hypothetical protein HMPREF9004_0900 [Schaalia cardiffensis F0333]